MVVVGFIRRATSAVPRFPRFPSVAACLSITQPSAVALYFLPTFYEVHSGIIMIVTIYIRSSLYVQNTKI